jgi:hypothetical protein
MTLDNGKVKGLKRPPRPANTRRIDSQHGGRWDCRGTHMTVSDDNRDRLWGMVPVSWLYSICSDVIMPGELVSTSGSGPLMVLLAKSLQCHAPRLSRVRAPPSLVDRTDAVFLIWFKVSESFHKRT